MKKSSQTALIPKEGGLFKIRFSSNSVFFRHSFGGGNSQRVRAHKALKGKSRRDENERIKAKKAKKKSTEGGTDSKKDGEEEREGRIKGNKEKWKDGRAGIKER